MQVLVNPGMPVVESQAVLFGYIVNVLDVVLRGSAFGYTLLSVCLIFAQALYLNGIVARHRLFTKTTYIPAFLFLLLTSLHPSFSYFSTGLVVNWCLLGIIDILLRFHQTTHPRKDVFNAGFLVALSALLHFQALVFIILLFAALILLRSFNPGEWVVTILGYLTPVYFWAGILFLFDRFDYLSRWPQLHFFFPEKIQSPLYLTGYIIGFIVLLSCGFYVLQGMLAKTSVFIRRNWVMLVICLFLCVITAISSNVIKPYIWVLMIPTSTLIISHALYMEKNKRFSNFAFYFSLLFLVFCQLA
jgi:hypothetical protein